MERRELSLELLMQTVENTFTYYKLHRHALSDDNYNLLISQLHTLSERAKILVDDYYAQTKSREQKSNTQHQGRA